MTGSNANPIITEGYKGIEHFLPYDIFYPIKMKFDKYEIINSFSI